MSRKTKTTAAKEEATPALVPKLRFPEFRDVEAWSERPIGDFLSESRLPGSKGNVAKKITVKLWGNGVFEKNDAIQGSINTQYFRRKAGQFIYSKLDFLNQAFGIIPPSLDNFESTVDLPCFDFTAGLNAVFLLEYVKRRDFYERLGETADGSRKARRIHAETFLSFPIALPTPTEQQKIAECLSSLDELIAAQARKLDALKTHKKGLMQQLFPREGETQPRLRFPEFQNAAEWEEHPLKKVFSIFQGFAFSSNDSVERGCRWLKIADVGIQLMNHDAPSFLPEDHKERFSKFAVREGDYVVALTRPILSGQLKIAKVDDIFDGALLNQRVGQLITSQHPAFVFLLLQTRQVTSDIEKSISGNDPPNLSAQQIEGIKTHVPRLPEQQRIADCLTSLDDLIAAQTQKLEALKTHKKGLMQQLFPSPDAPTS